MPDAESPADGESPVVMPDAELPAAGGSEVVMPDAGMPVARGTEAVLPDSGETKVMMPVAEETEDVLPGSGVSKAQQANQRQKLFLGVPSKPYSRLVGETNTWFNVQVGTMVKRISIDCTHRGRSPRSWDGTLCVEMGFTCGHFLGIKMPQ